MILVSRHFKHVQARLTAGNCAQVGPLLKQCTEGVLEGLNYLHTQNPPVVHRASAHIGQDSKIFQDSHRRNLLLYRIVRIVVF